MNRTDYKIFYRRSIRSKNFVLFVVALASFMALLDSSIINIALPTLSRYFNVGIGKVQWVVTIYGLAMISLLPLGSKLGNKFGQNRINALGYFLYGLGSLLCVLSGSLPALVLSRAIQGFGAAMLFSLSQGVVATIFTGQRRGMALGFIASCVALGNIMGPSLGGLLLDSFGWHSIFIINLPVAAFGAYYSYISLPSLKRARLGVINITSLFYFIIAAASLITAFSLAESAGWANPHILIMLGSAVFFGFLFYRHESRAKAPLINLSLYSIKTFAYGNSALVLVFMAASINSILIPFFLQDIYGLSAFKTGVLVLYFSIAMIVMAPVTGRLSGKYGSRELTVAGCALMIIGMLWYMSLGTVYKEYQIIIGQLLMGIANGLFQPPNNNSIMSSVPKRFYNDASALNSLARNLGIVTGVALTVNIFASVKGHFINLGYAVDYSFMKSYRYTLIMGILLMSGALVMSYIGKTPARAKK